MVCSSRLYENAAGKHSKKEIQISILLDYIHLSYYVKEKAPAQFLIADYVLIPPKTHATSFSSVSDFSLLE